MYSWGDDTSTWKTPGAYSYGDAMKPYLEKNKKISEEKGDRTYLSKKKPDLSLVDPKGKEISTDSPNPVIIAVDGTGSMQTWPAEIFDRLPLLYQTLSKYRPDTEISFSVIGDANSDVWPVQISGFGKGPTLDDYLKALQPEGGGGPGIRESYELWAYYVQQHVQTPKATSPFMIIMGDEKFYEHVDPEHVKRYLGGGLQERLDSKEVWEALSQRFDIVFLRKQYAGKDAEIEAQWKGALGEQRVIPLYDPTRAVDVAMGIIAKRWGQEGDYFQSLSARQDAPAIEAVKKSLRAMPSMDVGMNSKTGGQKSGAKSVKLA